MDANRFDDLARSFAGREATTRRALLRRAGGFVLLALVAPFVSKAKQTSGFALSPHRSITRAALQGQVGTVAMNTIVLATQLADLDQLSPEQHFDSARDANDICDLSERGLNRYLDRAVAMSAPTNSKGWRVEDVLAAREHIGYALHAVQDFWSHSNAVERKMSSSSTALFAQPCVEGRFPRGIKTGFFSLRYGADGCPSTGKPPKGSEYEFCHLKLNKDSTDPEESPHGASKPRGSTKTYHQLAVEKARVQSKMLWNEYKQRMRETYDGKDCMDAECLIKKVAYGTLEVCGCDDDHVCCDDGCANFDTDENNCGECGLSCGAGRTCLDGKCISAVCRNEKVVTVNSRDGWVVIPVSPEWPEGSWKSFHTISGKWRHGRTAKYNTGNGGAETCVPNLGSCSRPDPSGKSGSLVVSLYNGSWGPNSAIGSSFVGEVICTGGSWRCDPTYRIALRINENDTQLSDNDGSITVRICDIDEPQVFKAGWTVGKLMIAGPVEAADESPTPEATPTPTPEPTESTPTETAQPEPTTEPAPTGTPTPAPTATAPTEPTAEPTATSTMVPEPEPTEAPAEPSLPAEPPDGTPTI